MTRGANQQDYYTGYEFSGGNRTPSPASSIKLIKLAAAGIIILAVILTAWTLISAARQTRNTGTIAVRVSDPSAKITLLQAHSEPLSAGKGNVEPRVRPGTYTVMASASDKRSFETVTVDAQVTTPVDITLSDSTSSQKLAEYEAASAFATDTHVYFLNKTDRIPNSLAISESASRPYATTAFPASRLHWVNDTDFFVLQNKGWRYISNNRVQDLNINYRLSEGPVNEDAVAFSSTGAYTYFDDYYNILYASGPVTKPVKIGSVSGAGYRLSIAPDGSVVSYPGINSKAADKKIVRIKDGRSTELPITSSGIRYLAWSPNSATIGYVTADGIYTYDLASKRTLQIMNASVAESDSQSLTWIDDNSFVFAYDNTLWRYFGDSHTSNMLASYDGNLDPYPPLGIHSGFTYFGTTKGHNQAGGLYRIALDAKSAQQQPSRTSQPITYKNFDRLTKRGLSTDQTSNAKYAVSKYASSQKPTPRTVELSTSTISVTPRSRGTPAGVMEFTLKFDDAIRRARLEYKGISTVRLYLYDKQKLLFDSGEIH